MTFWDYMRHVRGSLQRLGLAPLSFLGLSFTRRWSMWVSSFSQGALDNSALFDVTILASNTLAMLGIALFARRRGTLCRGGWYSALFTVLIMVGSALDMVWTSAPVWLLVMGAAMFSVGFSGMFLMWIELYGMLPPREMIAAYSSSILIGSAMFLLFRNLSPNMAPYLVLCLPAVSFVCYVWRVLGSRERDLPRPSSEALHPSKAAFRRLVAWVAVFGLIFGLGEAVVQEGLSVSSIAGRAGFSMLMLVGILFFPRRFTLRIVYRLTLTLMIVGIFIAFFFSSSIPRFTQMFMSAGMEGFQAISIVVCCGLALEHRASAAYQCGIVFAVETATIQIGKVLLYLLDVSLGIADLGSSTTTAVIGTASIMGLSVATLAFFRENDLTSTYSEVMLKSLSEREGAERKLSKFAERFGLTKKEAGVLRLLTEGETTSQIADELYLASSTVRVHISNIYQKTGVHSREELADKVRESD